MQQLIDELKKPAYQGISDQAAADLVNALTVRKDLTYFSGELTSISEVIL